MRPQISVAFSGDAWCYYSYIVRRQNLFTFKKKVDYFRNKSKVLQYFKEFVRNRTNYEYSNVQSVSESWKLERRYLSKGGMQYFTLNVVVLDIYFPDTNRPNFGLYIL